MALTGRRRGLYRVAGGFTWTASRVSLIASVRPERIGWGVDRQADDNGYRGLRLGRLQVLLAHDLGTPRPGQRWRGVRRSASRHPSRPSVAERLAPYTLKGRR